jgi:2-iminobutanoate/2-iminopropanoate deaminase
LKNIIKTDLCPKAVGPYSQAVIVDGFLYASGQIGINPESGEIVEGGITEQTVQVMENIKNLLSFVGCTFDNVVKTTVFITDMGKFSIINEIYAKYFAGDPPARSCVEVSKLPKGALVEIEIVAHTA